MLQRMKYQIVATSCEKECIDVFSFAKEKSIEIALVLLDQNIKGNLGGAETIKELHQMGYENKAVVVTGSPNSTVMHDYTNYGFDGILLKPYTKKELEAVVRQFGPS
jgi:two-component system cell cycle sensor histidine kinase/response regulator CckA